VLNGDFNDRSRVAGRRTESEALHAKATACESENSGILSLFRSRRRSCSHAYQICPFRNIVRINGAQLRAALGARIAFFRCAAHRHLPLSKLRVVQVKS
jgi:hypothetical protein